MSALPPKADMETGADLRLLMTLSQGEGNDCTATIQDRAILGFFADDA